MERLGASRARAISRWQRMRPGLGGITTACFPIPGTTLLAKDGSLELEAKPAAVAGAFAGPPDARARLDAGLYLRTDFWVRIVSAEATATTCYLDERGLPRPRPNRVRVTLCIPGQRYDLLDTLGVQQVVHEPPAHVGNEEAIVSAPRSFTIRSSGPACGTASRRP